MVPSLRSLRDLGAPVALLEIIILLVQRMGRIPPEDTKHSRSLLLRCFSRLYGESRRKVWNLGGVNSKQV